MLKQPIYYEFNLDARTSPSKLIAISHVDDKYSEVLEVAVKQNDRFVYMGGATVIARMVLHRDKDYLLSDDVACSVNDNGNILIPFDNAVVKTSQGVVKIEVNITRDTDELTLQFPLWVSVNGSILDNAEVTPESKGTIPDLLKDAADALDDAKGALGRLGSYSNLEDKPQINGVTLDGDKTSDKFGVAGWKIAAIDNCIEDGVLYSTQINNQASYVLARNITTDITQYAFCRDGRVMWRTRQAETQWQPAGEWSEWEEIGGADDYNDLSNRPQIGFTGQSVTLSGVLNFHFGDFNGEVLPNGVDISLRENVFKSSLSPSSDILYNFNSIKSNLLYTGVFKIRKVDVTNLPQDFTDAGSTIYVYHYVTTKTYSDLIRMVTYDTADGVKMWIQLVTLGGMDASDNVQVAAQTDWVELTGTPKKDISGAVVTLNQSVYTYDGTSKAPSVTSVVLNGQTLTAGTDYAVIANPATNAGQYAVVVNGMGDYKGTVTTAWEIAKAQATISGDNSITITGIDDPVTKTYTTDGDGTFSFAIAGNIATVANVGGEVIITPTAIGNTTMTVTLSEGTNYLGATKTVPVEIVTVFGVVWDYSLSSPQLARLTPQTDPLGVVTTVPSQEPTACVGNDGNGQSDFDNYMPWAGIQRYNYVNGQVVDFVSYSNGETFVYIPEFWSKIVDDSTNSKMYFYISNSDLEGFTKHLGSGRYIARYQCDANFLSMPNGFPKVNTSFSDFREGITGIDNSHFQCDIHTYMARNLLYLIEYANFDSQASIGGGITSNSIALNLGGADTLAYHTGRSTSGNNAIQYRWMENIWGNTNEWVDGILVDGGLVYICNEPINYSSNLTEHYNNTMFSLSIDDHNLFITKLQSMNNQIIFPTHSTNSGSATTYVCDKVFVANGAVGVTVSGNWRLQEAAGLFYFNADRDVNNTYEGVGSRSILILGGES